MSNGRVPVGTARRIWRICRCQLLLEHFETTEGKVLANCVGFNNPCANLFVFALHES